MQLYVQFLISLNLNFKNLVSGQKIEVQGPLRRDIPTVLYRITKYVGKI